MQVGIKIGPNGWKERLEQSKAKLCEVWFRVDWEEKYSEMFRYLKRKKIKTGLHFWGVCANDIYPSLLTKNSSIRSQSIELMKKTINIASKYNFIYVNAHPEARRTFRLIFPEGNVILLKERTSDKEGKKYLCQSAQRLTEYAKSRNVLFLLETVPRLVVNRWWAKPRGVVDTGLVPSSWLELVGKNGGGITNDIGHIITEGTSCDPKILIEELKEKTERLAPFTKLLHASTTMPPFNGLDCHGGFSKEDFQKGAIPNLDDLKKIIKIFNNKSKDLMIIPEPETNHVENYRIISKIVKEIQPS